MTSPTISPDGKTIVWCAPYRGQMNIWARTRGAQKDRALTRFDRDGIGGFIWARNGRDILFASCRGGDENWHLLAVDLFARRPHQRDLTPFRGVRVNLLKDSPRHPDEVLVSMNRENREVFDVYLLNTKTGELTLKVKNPGNAVGWSADLELRVLGMETAEPGGGTALHTRTAEDAPWKELVRGGPFDDLNIAGFSADGQAAWLLSNCGSDTKGLIRHSFVDGSQTVVFRPEAGEIVDILSTLDSGEPLAVCVEHLRRQWIPLHPSVQEDFERLTRTEAGNFAIVSRDRRDKLWVVAYTADIGPVRYYLYDRQSREAQFLFSNRPQLEWYTRARTESLALKARDDQTLVCYLTIPPGVEPKGLPLVVLVHGGPWDRDSWGWHPDLQWLANRGYAVLQVNFRGSSGFGRSFLHAGDRQWGDGMLKDILDAVNWVVDKGIADPKRLGMMGSSFGGYAVLALAAFHPNIFACGVDAMGPSDLTAWLRQVPAYWKPAADMLRRRVGDTEEDADLLKAISPISHAERICAPLHIAHGRNDARVSPAEVRRLVATLQENDKSLVYLEFPDEGHGFSLYINALAYTSHVEEFLAKYLGGRVEPPNAMEKRVLARVEVVSTLK